MKYRVRAKIWIWSFPGATAWHFVTIPEKTSKTIKDKHGKNARGWRSIPVNVTLGTSVWKTSIFPEKDVYLLPLKAAIRMKEGVAAEDTISFMLDI